MLNLKRKAHWLWILVVLAAGGCGPAPAAPESPTLVNTLLPQSPATDTPRSTATPTMVPLPTPAPTPTRTPLAIQTPEPITFDIADRFQVIRESHSPEAYMKLFVVNVSPDGRMAAVGGCEPEEDDICYTRTVLRLIDVDTGETLYNLEPLSPVIESVSFSPDGSALAIAGCDLPLYLVGELDTICDDQRLWTVDTATGEILHEMGDFQSSVTSLVWSPDGARLYSGVLFYKQYDFVDNEITVFDTTTGKRLGILEPPPINGSHMVLQLSDDGRYLVVDVRAKTSSYVMWWDLQDPDRPTMIHQEVPAWMHALSPDGMSLLTLNSKDNTLRLFDMQTGKAMAGYPSVARHDELRYVGFLDSAHIFLMGRGSFQVLELASGEIERTVEPAGTRFSEFVFAPDGRTMVSFGSAGSDGLVLPVMSLWDMETWQETPIATFLMHDPWGARGPLWFSRDGTRLIHYSGVFISWGSRPAEQADALRVLQDYLGLLAEGEYGEAASQFILEESPAWNTTVLDQTSVALLVPEADPTDPVALLELLCTDPLFPCAPLRDITYQAQVDEDTYQFVVTFLGADGEVAAWPLCEGVPASQSCQRRDGMFEYYVRRQPDGGYKVVGGLPPAIGLRGVE